MIVGQRHILDKNLAHNTNPRLFDILTDGKLIKLLDNATANILELILTLGVNQ